MSKSLGNVVEPWEVINRYGADALRWYFFTSKYPWDGYRFSTRDDRRGGPAVPAAAVEHLRLLRPVRERQRRLAHGAVREGGPSELDRWALSRLQATVQTVRERMDEFDATGAGRAIAAFVDELSNWYVRRSRRRFWDGDQGRVRDAAGLPTHGGEAAGAVLSVSGRRDLRQPRRHRAERAPLRLPDRGPARSGARGCDGGRARDGAARAGGARAGEAQGAPAAARGGDRRGTGFEREAIERLAEIVREELNVRELRFVSEADELGEVEIKPNYRDARTAVRQADAAGGRGGRRAGPRPRRRGAARGTRRARSASTARTTSSAATDLLVTMKPLEGYQVEREGSHAVALELEIDDELRVEGWAREIVHAVQTARRDAGLEVSDRIVLTLDGDQALLDAARAHQEYIAARRWRSRSATSHWTAPSPSRSTGDRCGVGVRRWPLRPAPARARPRGASWGRRRSLSWPAGRGGTGSASGSTSR